MTYLKTQGSRVDYNYKEYIIDTAAELSTIDTASCCPGSVVYVIATGKLYMLNGSKQWKEQ